jgi:hypothetical protein
VCTGVVDAQVIEWARSEEEAIGSKSAATWWIDVQPVVRLNTSPVTRGHMDTE